jgi:hypothetical protein
MTKVEGQKVRVGDYVSFKCDIEQSAKIKKIHTCSSVGKILILKAPAGGFQGEYIRDEKTYGVTPNECWIE